MEAIEKVIVKGNGQMVPAGFAPLVGEDLAKWQTAKLGVECFKSHVRESEARIREHQNGLEAAKLQRAADQAQLDAGIADLVQAEAELGIKKPDDLKSFGGKFFRRVNGEAKPAEADSTKVKVETTVPPATEPAAAAKE